MINIINLLRINKDKAGKMKLFGLNAKERKKLIVTATEKANKEQISILRKAGILS